ncbi:hypothetical protein G6F70_001544 [Rhizopus microsporus]|uniref:Hyaluronan/mRNA-binding protein domain-containing protein n=1 Tax=Rhizopus microsporus TaxID=58291 RepID=A0A1X0S8R4_RHIZD|nr:hypothetical protein G6F71_001813 [Rhizopus microsporus]KAG1203246.1 hypothetical protein G6F70_001544 [Rhizopus microsporus]KAG1216346.1 hypothetical protein G6F69_000108 [Rhizopus microsporus]KAG1238397.1 hypothetical protein G6F67_000484 [Rhizopus microsporus]KAG1268990.1 hypothetical protein G6F68_000625 [Rhizopus microsporus]
MSTFSKNLFDVLAEQDNTPVKAESPAPAAAAADKKNAPKAKEAPKGEKKARRHGDRPTKDGRPRRGRQFDRHSGTGLVDSQKKINQGWGKPGKAEVEAAKDTLNPADPDAPEQEAPATPVEPEEKVKTLDEYLAEKAAKALKVALPEARKANDADEAAFAGAVVHTKAELEEFYVSKETKTVTKKTEKPRKEKIVIEIEQRFQEKPRNDFRKNDRRGGRNGGRKSAKSNFAAVNIQDAAAFPSLGATA